MSVKKIWLVFMEKIFKFLRKDPMKYRLERYRLYGATIGQNVRAFSPISSAESYMITIGDNVTISTGVKFCTHDNSAIKIFKNGTDFVGKIEIGDNSFIGMNTILVGGVKIAENCIIGAGSVVTKSCDVKGSVLAGNPARVIGTVDSMKKRYEFSLFNFKEMTSAQKREKIISHPEMWIRK